MPEKVVLIGHNEAHEIVLNFEPDQPEAWHVVLTLDEAEDFAQTILRRVHEVREQIAANAP
jgi:hypothetical protein